MKAKIENGKVTGFYIGLSNIKDCIDVPDAVAIDPNRFNYDKGKFVEKNDVGGMNVKSLEQRVRELEATVANLKGLQVGMKADV